jgi:hypothetical protein
VSCTTETLDFFASCLPNEVNSYGSRVLEYEAWSILDIRKLQIAVQKRGAWAMNYFQDAQQMQKQ